MPASTSSVTLLGFGNGTFSGSVNLLPTLGFGLGAAPTTLPWSGGLVADHHTRVLIADHHTRVLISDHHTRVLIAGQSCC